MHSPQFFWWPTHLWTLCYEGIEATARNSDIVLFQLYCLYCWHKFQQIQSLQGRKLQFQRPTNDPDHLTIPNPVNSSSKEQHPAAQLWSWGWAPGSKCAVVPISAQSQQLTLLLRWQAMQIAATPIVCLCLEKQWTLWTRTNCMRARVFLSVLATAISFPNRFWFHPGACVVLLVWCAQFNNPEQPFTGSKLAKCHASSTNLSDTSHCFFLFSSSSHVENLRWISILRHSKVSGWCVRQDCMQNKQLCCLADLLFLTALHCRTTFGAAMGLANTTYLLPFYIFLPTSRRVVAIAMEVIKGQRSEWHFHLQGAEAPNQRPQHSAAVTGC